MESGVLLSQVRAYFEAHGAARFEPEGHDSERRPVHHRAGFRRQGEDGLSEEYLVLPESFKEIINGHNQKWATKVLVQAGWIKPGKDCVPQSIRVDGLGKRARLYVLDGNAIHTGE